jgi:hypothetical protein
MVYWKCKLTVTTQATVDDWASKTKGGTKGVPIKAKRRESNTF